MEFYYRYQESLYTESKLILCEHEYPIIKRTKHGVWIDVFGSKKFVLGGARKRYACPTKEEALESYYARKKRQHRILSHQLRKVEAALELKPGKETGYIDF